MKKGNSRGGTYFAALWGIALLSVVSMGLLGCSEEDDPVSLSGEKDIISFSIGDTIGSIDHGARTIVVDLPPTAVLDITKVKPKVKISDKASIYPRAVDEVDFSRPSVYAVTAENGTEKQYTVTVLVKAPSSAKDIVSFVIDGHRGFIDADRQISVIVDDADVKKLKPVITISEEANVFPASDAEVDFTYPVTYTVTAKDGTTAQYRVTVIPGGRLTSISAVPVQTEYAYGEKLDPENIVVTGYYAATGTSQREEIEAENLSEYDPNKIGSQQVLVTLNGQTAVFTVTVKAPSSAKDIVSFAINGKNGFIDANRQISVDIDGDADVTALTPDITFSDGATVVPDPKEAVDFTYPVIYTVTAADGTETQYRVTVIPGVRLTSLGLTVGLPDGVEIPFSVTSGPGAVDLTKPIQISAHGVNGQYREIVISTSSQYSSHAWYKDGKKIADADGAVYTIKAADNYIYGKEYSVTFVGTTGTAPSDNQPDYRIRYSKDIRFTVAY